MIIAREVSNPLSEGGNSVRLVGSLTSSISDGGLVARNSVLVAKNVALSGVPEILLLRPLALPRIGTGVRVMEVGRSLGSIFGSLFLRTG